MPRPSKQRDGRFARIGAGIGGTICERIVQTGAFVLLNRNPLQAYIAGLAFGESLSSLKFTKLEPMPGFHIEHFGCRAARADGEAIAGRLRAFAERQPFASDVVVVNTCSVTAEADRAARAFIRRAHRRNPAAKIVVTGCYAQRAPQELASMAGVAAVVGNSHKALAPDIVFKLVQGPADSLAHGVTTGFPPSIVPVEELLSASAPHTAPIWADDRFAHSFIEDAQLVPGAQTRPNLKIQEGCGNRCTFCIIPHTRGPSRSLPAASVMRQVEAFVAAGGKELVISGINLGRWGRDFSSSLSRDPFADPRRMSLSDLERETLAKLIRSVLTQTDLPRLRLSSIEPMDWDSDLIALFGGFGVGEFGGSRLARHAHLPLQSGSDAVLRRMHRRYRPWHYADKAAALMRAAGPDLTLGADVMVGFPGETDLEFEETLAFTGALPFGYLHLFPFSPRPGTSGWALHAASPVPPAVVEARIASLRVLAAEKTLAHRQRFIGRELSAITLNRPGPLAAGSHTAALSENFLPISLVGHFPSNQLLQIRVAGIHSDGSLIGFAS
jgi:threonylcarbamoyladenosine tRNA methylthiotransferase MtaB